MICGELFDLIFFPRKWKAKKTQGAIIKLRPRAATERCAVVCVCATEGDVWVGREWKRRKRPKIFELRCNCVWCGARACLNQTTTR